MGKIRYYKLKLETEHPLTGIKLTVKKSRNHWLVGLPNLQRIPSTNPPTGLSDKEIEDKVTGVVQQEFS